MPQVTDMARLIFAVADDALRGPYKPNEYGKVVLPMTVLRRLDCVLAPTKQAVLDAAQQHEEKVTEVRDALLNRVVGGEFHNASPLDFDRLKADPENVAANLRAYIAGFSPEARSILEKFELDTHIEKLAQRNRLYLVVKAFANVDLHPDRVPNEQMGTLFEELVRKYNEDANETAGDHFTPREVIRLMVNLTLGPDSDTLTTRGIVRTLYDPTCGTGGMLAAAEDHLQELNPDASLEVFGQDYNPESYAVCGSDMLIKGHRIDHIAFGDTLGDGETADAFPDRKFDYMLANPPFGVKWEAQKATVTREHEDLGHAGRFGVGLPGAKKGEMLFLQHMLSKMQPPAEGRHVGGSRLAIVFNGGPLFAGDAGSGESNIRRWIIENDWLEAVVGLPDQLFYSTGISTYLWVLTNRKAPERRGKVQLINAADAYSKMTKSLGDKRNQITDPHLDLITRVHGDFAHDDRRTFTSNGQQTAAVMSKLLDNADFGYRKVTVERPLRLRLQVTDAGLAALAEQTAFANLAKSKKKNQDAAAADIAAGQQQQRAILDLLRSLPPGKSWMDRAKFDADLKTAAKSRGTSGGKLTATLRKAIHKALGEADPDAEICRDAKGQPEPDTDLRDHEYVPLEEDVDEYFDREVRPHVPDAWIDESKTDPQDGKVGIVGYEIPFGRHFYEYQPPRPLADIEADIRGLEAQIVAELKAVLA